MAVNFNKFFNILYANAVEVYPDIRNSRLDIWQFVGKRLVVFIRYELFFNKSSHPSNCSRFASLVFLYNIYVLCCRYQRDQLC
jgi:hypothetical protein